jgi:hypothetical protein
VKYGASGLELVEGGSHGCFCRVIGMNSMGSCSKLFVMFVGRMISMVKI